MKLRWLKNISFLVMCGLLSFVYFQTKDTNVIDKEVVVTSYDGYRQVVYMDEDRLLIPVTYEVKQSTSIEEDVNRMFLLMKDAGNLKGTLSSIVPSNADLLNVAVNEDGILCLDFSTGLNELKEMDELRFLEATSYVFCQLEGVEGIQYAMNGELLKQLPNGKINLESPLDFSLGINNFETSSDNLHHTTSMLVFLAKTIDDEEFYVPVSKRVPIDETLDEKLNHIIGEVSVSSTLKQASPLQSLELLDGSSLENGHLLVNLNTMALLDEMTIDQDVYDLLLLSFSRLEGVQDISIQVQGQDIQLPETQKVSEIIYNVVKI